MLRTNKENLVKLSVQGEVSAPIYNAMGKLDHNGHTFVLPGTGGISYNVKIGDPACTFMGDHVEPGVSTKNYEEKASNAYNFLSCVGNETTVITGGAKGRKGFVTGTHGGIEHVIMYFDPETLELLNIGDKINVRAFGQGLKLLDWPDITVMNLDPALLEKMNITEEDGRLIVPVAKTVPGCLMGSGLGANTTKKGDYDITMFDEGLVKEYGLDELRFGDIVALLDCDNTNGRNFITGALSIGVIVHGSCLISGHGPGVTTLFSCLNGKLGYKLDPKANLADILL
ncbi:MAG: DUF4438 domain-containing protein [Lachnospiraceae bacterium]|nr:DUF4438 domain-containing protein [Lachnospiraceae bacterium]